MRPGRTLAMAVFLVLGPAAGLAAQEAGAGEEVDSSRLRVLGRLRSLAKAPGLDSVNTHLDSIQARRDREGARRGGGVGPRDSTAAALMELDGYTPTSYTGTGAHFDAQRRRLDLRGDSASRPEVSRDGMRMSADSAIVYDEASGRIRALGNARYEAAEGDPLESETLIMDIDRETGSALDARTRYSQAGTEWIVRGDLPAVRPNLVYGSHTTFTSCTLERPHYHFQTDEIKIHQNNVLVARPVRLYFEDVPVAWLPFIAQSLGDGRASGLLTPRFSINDIVRTSRGYNRRISNVGFYWAMSDYTDASLALDWFSDNYTAVTGTFRYDWMRQFLNGSLNFRRYWRDGGNTELAFDTRHQWEMSERTRFSMAARFASSTDFVRQNSFDPREVTRTIRSEGGFNHRFDWGSLNVGANRQQFLSDDRVEWTLPSASLSLSPITLFQAPASRAAFYNNITWNGSVSMSRRLTDHADQALDTTFTASRADQVNESARLSSSLTLGNLSLSQSAQYRGNTTQGLPDFLLSPTDGSAGTLASAAARQAAGMDAREEVTTSDLTEEQLDWSASLNYQQHLIGSTTITPSLSFSGRQVRNDTLSAASGFVSAPTRMSFGARLKTDVYGFYPGFGRFDAIRHKLSPSFRYDFSPAVTPNELQERVFGTREIQTRNVVSIDLNQTWEARIPEEELTEEERRAEADSAAAADSLAAADTAGVGGPQAADSAAADTTGIGPGGGRGGGLDRFQDESLERVETGRKMMLLALKTSAVTYDFVQADSAGEFLGGFTTTTLSNSIRSDYLRGLSIQVRHDLFDQGEAPGGGGAGTVSPGEDRSFSPHLSSVNLSFQLNNRSSVFDLFGLLDDDEDDEEQDPQQDLQPQEGDPFSSTGGTDEQSIIPGSEEDRGGGGQQDGVSGDVGEWNASLSYSLQRPRDETRESSQMLQMNLSFRPTEQWDVSWRTSYDGNAGRFNDHMIRLTRDLHRWRANFDFRQTATGNWSFRFEVSLMDNEDLHFDYEQRSQLEGGRRRR